LLHHGNKFELIVNIASTAGINGRSGWLTYSASKAAVINMSEVMREELSSMYGTRVVCISPGRTATDLRRTLAPEEDPTTIMQPEHVAAVIEMLASEVGRFVDSQNIVVRK
ncbi:MAG: SDR family oxidoreductase, partial [Acidothermales bacterium]|nr:SDR family oxidoreductase [Acidothermales bacterium]